MMKRLVVCWSYVERKDTYLGMIWSCVGWVGIWLCVWSYNHEKIDLRNFREIGHTIGCMGKSYAYGHHFDCSAFGVTSQKWCP